PTAHIRTREKKRRSRWRSCARTSSGRASAGSTIRTATATSSAPARRSRRSRSENDPRCLRTALAYLGCVIAGCALALLADYYAAPDNVDVMFAVLLVVAAALTAGTGPAVTVAITAVVGDDLVLSGRLPPLDQWRDELVDLRSVDGNNSVELDLRSRDLRTTLEAAVDQMRAVSRGHRLRYSAHADDAPVMSTYDAIKYSPDGGDIDIELRVKGEMVRVTVRDHGMGIPPDEQAHIVEPGFARAAHAEFQARGLA